MKGSASRPSSATMNGTRWGHQAGNERDIAGEAVELRDQDTALGVAGRCERSCELGPPIERVGALSGLGFDVFRNDPEVLGFGEPGDCCALGLDPEPGAVLLPCGDTIVGDSAFHTNCIPPYGVWS